jgi:hypothetical protein
MAIRDISRIIQIVSSRHPEVEILQLRVTHDTDDDGLWFFKSPNGPELQLESTTGNCPFLVESNTHDGRKVVDTVQDALYEIEQELARWDNLIGQ